MKGTVDQVTEDALGLSKKQKFALAELLLESADAEEDSAAETAWTSEIRDRIETVDQGRVVGVNYEEVKKTAETRLRA